MEALLGPGGMVFVVRKKPGPKGPGFSSVPPRQLAPKHCTAHYGMVSVTVVVWFTPPPVPFTVIG